MSVYLELLGYGTQLRCNIVGAKLLANADVDKLCNTNIYTSRVISMQP